MALFYGIFYGLEHLQDIRLFPAAALIDKSAHNAYYIKHGNLKTCSFNGFCINEQGGII
jgi:hypothetical protein